MDKVFSKDRIYPELKVSLISSPSRLYAIPLIGILIKAVAVIPVALMMLVLVFYLMIINAVNSLVVLIQGKYWMHAYQMNLNVMRLFLKARFYLLGLTDRYPGFDFQLTDPLISLNVSYPESPNRLFAIPVVGGLARIILIIPFSLYDYILMQASTWGAFLLAWAWVLIKGKYPEWIYELTWDSHRVQLSLWSYFAGLEDRYPSFWISLNHKVPKLILIGAILLLAVWWMMDNQEPEPIDVEDYTSVLDIYSPQE